MANQLCLGMEQAIADLPDEVEALRAIVKAQAAKLALHASNPQASNLHASNLHTSNLHAKDTLIEKLKAHLAIVKRARFGFRRETIHRIVS